VSSPSSSSPGRGRDDTRRRILEAARELFGTEGFDCTTVRQIASAVGITDAALYYHFKSKREILTAIWDLPLDGGVGRRRPDGAFSNEQLDGLVDASLDFTIGNDRLLRLRAREILAGDQTASHCVCSRAVMHDPAGTLTTHEAEEAEIKTEAIIALLTGTSMKTQLSAGPSFPADVDVGVYRERTRRWVRALARLDDHEAC
jgi:AcrR family transcriptional regulator